MTALRILAGVRVVLLQALLVVELTACEERSRMTQSESAPATGQSTGRSTESIQPASDELRRRCMEILERVSPVGQPLTSEDEQMAGLIERPGQLMTQIAPLGRPHVTVDIRGIIVGKRCY
jgi:hypothetical protein